MRRNLPLASISSIEKLAPGNWELSRKKVSSQETSRSSSRMVTVKFVRRSEQQSRRFQRTTDWIEKVSWRSSSHQLGAPLVWVIEPSPQLPLVLPSMARIGSPPQPIEDWVARPPPATFSILAGGAGPFPVEKPIPDSTVSQPESSKPASVHASPSPPSAGTRNFPALPART